MHEYLPWHRSGFDHTLLKGIEGWLSAKEADCLYRLARQCSGKGVIVEIGSWKGKSTTCLTCGSRDGAHLPVFAIDPHTGSSEHGDVHTFDEFMNNIQRNGLEELVRPIVKTSTEAARDWKEPVELLWIDGAHEEEHVQNDVRTWLPHLIEGGIIAFHDSTMPGPWNVIEEMLYRGSAFRKIRFVHGITYAVKGQNTPLCNRGMMLLRNGVYGVWKIKKALQN